EQSGLAFHPTLSQTVAQQSAGIPRPWHSSPSVLGPKRGVAAAFSKRSRLIRLPLPVSSEPRVVCPTCRSMLILKQALGSLTAHQSEARPAAVAELEDGGSWAERAFRHRLWRVSSTRLAISQPPATASSQRFIAILQILRTSKISQLITAVRSPGCRAKRVGISARALAVFKARLESKKVARIPGQQIRSGCPRDQQTHPNANRHDSLRSHTRFAGHDIGHQ